MSAAKHTPGPWRPVDIRGRSYVEIDGPPGTHVVGRTTDGGADAHSFEQTMADARLMAAAPDLLEALEDIIEQAEKTRLMIGPDLADSIQVFGKVAVAKARGGA